MKLSDLSDATRFERLPSRTLKGDLSRPIDVRVYQDRASREVYEVHVAERRYRKSDKPAPTQGTPPFGEWDALTSD
ncbi:MAG TPA: hypothetical protein VLJ42_10440 [Solirubrobacteraceae bacterium]|nr:hypothetical protein [Solirubrobacteraceae bacterium]